MAFERKDMTGALFQNDKEGNDKRPDWRGSVLIDGKTWYVSAWEAIAQSSGERYLSLKVGAPKPKGEHPNPNAGFNMKAAEQRAGIPAKGPGIPFEDDEIDSIPF